MFNKNSEIKDSEADSYFIAEDNNVSTSILQKDIKYTYREYKRVIIMSA